MLYDIRVIENSENKVQVVLNQELTLVITKNEVKTFIKQDLLTDKEIKELVESFIFCFGLKIKDGS